MENKLSPKNQNCNTDAKVLCTSNQDKGKNGQKYDHGLGKTRTSKLQVRTMNSNTTQGTTTGVTVAASRMNSSIRKNNSTTRENVKTVDQSLSKNASIVTTNQSSNSNLGNVSSINNSTGHTSHDLVSSKSKDYGAKKFSNELDSKIKNYHQAQSDYKEATVNHQDYKSKSSNASTNLPPRFTSQSSSNVQILHRENHHLSSSAQHSRPTSRNDSNTAFAMARKALEQHNSVAKMAPVNFPPLRAPQSIVNVRHPFVTEARTKQNELAISSVKSKLSVASSLQSSVKDLDHGRQTFHSYGASSIAGIASIQSLANVAANISQYPRPDSFQQATVASVLFPETAQFPHSPSFSTAQVGQLNQFQTYDPGSFATTPVNVNPVIPQFSADNSIPYSPYENPQFVQPNHYATAEMANSQYQYQTAGVGQIQDSPVFIQSLQSPIAVADQYAAPNYARAVRTELIPRLRRPPRFNK